MRGKILGVAGPGALLLAVLLGSSALAEEAAGLVITRVASGSVAERRGLRPGDRLLRWEQGDASGALDSPFALHAVELERAPRGEVRLSGLQEKAPLSVVLFPDDWGIEVRPDLPDEALAAYEEARRRLSEGDAEDALAQLAGLAQQPSISSTKDARPWLAWEELRGAADAGLLDRAKAAAERGAGGARREGRPQVEAQFLTELARVLEEWGRLDQARSLLAEALVIRRALPAPGLAVAATLTRLSRVALAQSGDHAQAKADLAEAAAIHDRVAPESLAHAATLDVLAFSLPTTNGMVQTLEQALTLKETLAPESLAVAETLFRLTDYTYDVQRRLERAQRAQQIRHRLAAGTMAEAASLSNLADALRRLGDTRSAEEHERQALAIRERRRPGSLQVAESLKNLGTILQFRGDFMGAERAILRAIEICEKAAPEAELLGRLLNNLGHLQRLQGDFAAAEAHLNRALSAATGGGESDVLAGVLLINLGNVAFDQGNLPLARLRFQRADAMIKAIDPERPVLAYLQRRLGELLFAQGELAEAESLYQAALAKDEKRYPRSIQRSELHHALGELALRRGDLDAAERSHRAALALREELAPGSLWEAESCHALGTLSRRRGRTAEALGFFRRAIGALDIQIRNLGTSPEVRTRFRARHQAIYRDLEELLLELGRPEEAFRAVESSRARSLLALLKARDLEFAAVPEEVERERRLADAEYDRALASLGAPSADNAQRERIRGDLEAARLRQDAARAKIRAAAPLLAAMRDPQPLDLAGLRRALAPGTLLLAYSLDTEGSRLYAVGPGPEDFAVSRLEIGEVALREDVRRFRESIQTARGRLRRPALLDRSRRLGKILLSPVTAQLAAAERVLIVPDGALHALPFGALGLPAPGGPHRFLVEAKPLHTASSVTLYAELVRPQEAEDLRRQVVGFGDPEYPRGAADGGPQALRSALRGVRLVPLPWTRNELQALAQLAPEKPQLWLGTEATEERAKGLGGQHRIIHFACHGVLDEAFPLESGLALSIPAKSREGGENGLLQAWEIFESLRIDADLVTLSACQTALGKEVAGEGLLGLTWAFQYAGARSVLASLWEVSDASTADLMRHFYGELGRGVSKSEALRRAQLELLKRPATRAPFYWAAFELIGDWR